MGTHRTAAACVAAVLLATTALGITAPSAYATPATTSAGTTTAASPTAKSVHIPGSGGITLHGSVATPGGYDGSQSYPLLVLPSSWGADDSEYTVAAAKLAASGYVVVSYTPRGFGDSGGEIDVAGPKDIADSSKVIDWALANTPADPDRIGMAGVSYGAGISLLAAAADSRVKAVASLSGWADLIESIFSGRTQHLQAAALLGGAAYLTGDPSDELEQILSDFLSSRYDREDAMRAWGKLRSPAAYLDRLNANGAAIMLANGWGDSLFPPNSYADFYDKLTVPKRLELRPGDHATNEASGLLGLPNDVWTDTERWLDHYLKGSANGIDSEAPVQLKSRTGSGGYEGYASWSAVSSGTRTITLDGTRRILANVDSGADGGIVFLTSLLDAIAQAPPVVSVPLLPRAVSAVWQSDRYSSAQRIRGTVKLHTTVTPSAAMGTFVAYLYDVDALGTGKLVTHAPYTFTDRTAGTSFGVDLELFSTAYDIAKGHRLALVVDTVDPLYIEHNPAWSTIAFSSPADDPSTLSVPLG